MTKQQVTMLTHATITADQVEALRAEALTAGDGEQVDICDRALNAWSNGRYEAGETKWAQKCADVINYARGEAQS